jgi:hypothetical protein
MKNQPPTMKFPSRPKPKIKPLALQRALMKRRRTVLIKERGEHERLYERWKRNGHLDTAEHMAGQLKSIAELTVAHRQIDGRSS